MFAKAEDASASGPPTGSGQHGAAKACQPGRRNDSSMKFDTVWSFESYTVVSQCQSYIDLYISVDAIPLGLEIVFSRALCIFKGSCRLRVTGT